MKTVQINKSHIDPKALATALANAAQDQNEEYQFAGIVAGKAIQLTGLGYHLSLFLIDGADYGTAPDTLNTRAAFKAYITNTLNGA